MLWIIKLGKYGNYILYIPSRCFSHDTRWPVSATTLHTNKGLMNDDCSHVSIIFTPHQTMGNRTFISEERRLNSWKWLNLYINKDTFFQEKNLPLKIFITVASEKLSQYETRVNYSSWTKSLSRNWPGMLHWKYIFYFISTLASRKLLSRWMDVKIVCFPEKSKLIYQPK